MRVHLEKFRLAGVAALLAAFFAVGLLWPLFYALREAVWPDGGGFTLQHIAGLFARGAPQLEWLGNSLALAGISTALCCALAYPLAYAHARCSFWRQEWLAALLLLPLVMPPFVGAIGLRRMLARYGSINLLLMKFGLVNESQPIDFLDRHRMAGCVLVMVLHLYPLLYLNLGASIGRIDPALLESSRNLGMTPWRTFWRVIGPLSLPGLLAGGTLVFINAFMDLGTPLIFGFQNTIARQIYALANEQHANPAAPALVAVTTVLMLALFAAAQWAAYRWGGGRGNASSGVKGQSRAAAQRVSKPVQALIVVGHVLVIGLALLPHVAVLLAAFSERWFMSVLPDSYSLRNLNEALSSGIAGFGMRNSLVYAALSTLADVVLGLMCAWAIVRGGGWWGRFVDGLSLLPLAVPGLVLAFGYVGAYAPWMNGPLLGAGAFLVLSYAIRRLPYTVRAGVAGLQQTPVELELAATGLGATPFAALRRITLPLMHASIAAGAILAFAFAMLEVSDSIVLATRQQDYPLTKAIYALFGNPGNGDQLASALGVVALLFLSCALLAAGSFTGRRFGDIFKG
jgi:iron(III) transport system permease protein